MPMRIWRLNGSTRLQKLAVRNIVVLISMSNGNKLVGVYYRMGMKCASKSHRHPEGLYEGSDYINDNGNEN
eukprot:scaffold41325_cov16-Tisochrysis_lutea.AAC.1